MKIFSRLALTIGAASLFATSAAVAGEDLPNGAYGDPDVATFTETSRGASIELPCQTAVFDGPIALDGDAFAVYGLYGSPEIAQSEWSRVLMTGTYSPGGCEKNGVCFPVTLSVTLRNAATLKSIGDWTFTLGASGATDLCE